MLKENFQRFASEQGESFRKQCADALRYAGFEIIGNEFYVPEAGITLDIHVQNANGIDFLVECKGSMRGDRPGCMRTDTTKKAIANGFLFSLSGESAHFPPMLLMTSHVADRGDALTMLLPVPTTAILDVLHPWNHGNALHQWARADDRFITAHLNRFPTLGPLLRSRWNICTPIAAD